jgi:hypothetical protein
VAVVEPKQNVPNARYPGIGGSFASAGLPTLGYFGAPSHLNMVAADGCISKLNKEIYHGQVEEHAKLLLSLDTTPVSGLQRLAPTPRQGAPSRVSAARRTKSGTNPAIDGEIG